MSFVVVLYCAFALCFTPFVSTFFFDGQTIYSDLSIHSGRKRSARKTGFPRGSRKGGECVTTQRQFCIKAYNL